MVEVSSLEEARDHVVHHPDKMLVLLNANRTTRVWLRMLARE